MMPISTPPNSIIYGSGLVPMRQMITSGIILDLLGFAIVVLSLRVILPLMGWW
jgi:sodium-dependent dicarboxylate transporter 2/3/5